MSKITADESEHLLKRRPGKVLLLAATVSVMQCINLWDAISHSGFEQHRYVYGPTGFFLRTILRDILTYCTPQNNFCRNICYRSISRVICLFVMVKKEVKYFGKNDIKQN